MRIISNNPANLQLILVSINDAITYRHILKPLFEFGETKFENAKQTVAQENLEKNGIENQSLFWSLGIFAVVFIFLVILFALYFLILYLRKKIPGLSLVEKYLKKKLFYNGIIRYMI